MIDLIPLHFAHHIAGFEPDGYVSGEECLQSLPGLLRDLVDEWELEPTGRSMSGYCSVVIPVRVLGTGGAAVLT